MTKIPVEIDEDLIATQEFLTSLLGRTIVGASARDANPNYDWASHEEFVLLLDDGRLVIVNAWGHDAYGVNVYDDGPV